MKLHTFSRPPQPSPQQSFTTLRGRWCTFKPQLIRTIHKLHSVTIALCFSQDRTVLCIAACLQSLSVEDFASEQIIEHGGAQTLLDIINLRSDTPRNSSRREAFKFGEVQNDIDPGSHGALKVGFTFGTAVGDSWGGGDSDDEEAELETTNVACPTIGLGRGGL